MTYETVSARAAAAGLAVRGAFHPVPGDEVPALADGSAPGTVVLLGNVGPSMWAAFRSAPERDPGGDGLDRWSTRVIGALARELGGQALFPFGGPPWLPFVRWAQRAEPVWPSPIGPLVHPDHGLWHAYRGALAFAARMTLPPRVERRRPCDDCADRPCLTACPVGAFGEHGYDVPACTRHVASAEGAACLEAGCKARHACPVGRDRAYPPGQAEHHMRAFLRANAARD